MQKSNSADQITPNTLKAISHEAQSNFNSPVDRCFQISECIQQLLDRRFNIDVGIKELNIGEKRVTHYVNTLPMEAYTNGTSEGTLLIDGSISQFATEYAKTGVVPVDLGPKEQLPQTALYEPKCEERLIWYCSPNDIEIVGELSL